MTLDNPAAVWFSIFGGQVPLRVLGNEHRELAVNGLRNGQGATSVLHVIAPTAIGTL